ncbi:MAG: cytidine deaminase [Thermoleophilia bacterium]
MELTPSQKELLAAAIAAADNAWAPASGFRVGAALRGKGGIHTGCNVENASLGLTICAERVAVFKAVSEGERQFSQMVVVAADGADAEPCGACRQVLAELAPGLQVTYRHQGRFVTTAVADLLPSPFGGDAGTEG